MNKLNPANLYNKLTKSQREALKNNKKITDWLNNQKPLRNQKHVEDFEYAMYDKAAKAKTVLEFVNKMPDSCYLHPGSSHKFLDCDLARDICGKCKKEGILNQTIGHTEDHLTNLKIKHEKKQNKKQSGTIAAQAKRITALESNLETINSTLSQVATIVPKINSLKNLVETNMMEDYVPANLIGLIESDDDNNIDNTDERGEVDNKESNTVDNSYTTITCILKNTSSLQTQKDLIPLIQNRSPPKITFYPDTLFRQAYTSKPTQPFFNSLPFGQSSPIWYSKATTLNVLSTQKSITTADSRATHDMNGVREQFEEIFPLLDEHGNKPQVLLGDNHTTCDKEGYSYVRYAINGYPIRKVQLYIPALGQQGHLTSIIQHSKYCGCYFHVEKNLATLAFSNKLITVPCTGIITMTIEPLSPTAYVEMAERYTTTTATVPFYSAKLAKSIDNSLIYESTVIDNMAEIVKFQKLDPAASIPSRQSDGAVGYDVTTQTNIQLNSSNHMLHKRSCFILQWKYQMVCTQG